MKKVFIIFLGCLFIIGGILSLLSILGVVNVSTDGWWTLFIIIPAIYGLITSKEKTGDLVFLSFGVYLLLAARGIIKYDIAWKLLIPTIILLIGVKIVVKALFAQKKPKPVTENINNAYGAPIYTTPQKVNHLARIAAVFGGSEHNLYDVKFAENNELDLLCVFGGTDIIVPDYVEVEANTFSLFGGISDKRVVNPNIQKTVKLKINGFILFGGADIK